MFCVYFAALTRVKQVVHLLSTRLIVTGHCRKVLVGGQGCNLLANRRGERSTSPLASCRTWQRAVNFSLSFCEQVAKSLEGVSEESVLGDRQKERARRRESEQAYSVRSRSRSRRSVKTYNCFMKPN